jgi:hypothetical protein
MHCNTFVITLQYRFISTINEHWRQWDLEIETNVFRKYLFLFSFSTHHYRGSTNDSRLQNILRAFFETSINAFQIQTAFNTLVSYVCPTVSKTKLKSIIPRLSKLSLICLYRIQRRYERDSWSVLRPGLFSWLFRPEYRGDAFLRIVG